MSKIISEETKKRISDLYKSVNKSVGTIANELDVSERSVHRYKNYGKMDSQSRQSSPTSLPESASPSENSLPRQTESDKALDIAEGTSPTSRTGEALEATGKPRLPCSDQALGVPGEPSLPQKSKVEYGERIEFVGGTKNKEPKIETAEEEEFDWTCPCCGDEFNGTPSYCPHCGNEVEYPDRYQLKTQDGEEMDWTCPICGKDYNGQPKYCPYCDAEVEY